MPTYNSGSYMGNGNLTYGLSNLSNYNNLMYTPPTANQLSFGSFVDTPSVNTSVLSGLGSTPNMTANAIAAQTATSGNTNTNDPVPTDVTGDGWFSKIGGFKGLSNLAEGLSSLGQLYTSIKALGLAEDQLDFTKEAYNTNLANTTQSYNTALEDRIRARYAQENKSSAAADEYIAKHSL